MNLPDFMAYKDKFTQSAFVEKISHVAKRRFASILNRCFYEGERFTSCNSRGTRSTS
jgi:hypothetical protein